MIRVLAVLAAVVSVSIGIHASNPPRAEIIATLDLSQLPAGTKDASAQSIAFVSDSSIAVGLCPSDSATGCSLSLVHRQGNVLRPYASTSHFRPGMSIHASSEGQILAIPLAGSRAVLLAADLSTVQELPSVHAASQSGDTATEFMRGGWKIYQVKSRMELIREGKGSLRSVSDEVVVFQDGNTMRIETLQGTGLGSFSVKPEMKCYNVAYPLSTNRLYLDDCRKIRIVDFSGTEQAELHPPNGYRAHQLWSGDGKRILFDNFGRKISMFRNAGEILLAVGTLGAGVADEQSNREEVLVLDTSTGDSSLRLEAEFRGRQRGPRARCRYFAVG